MTIETSPRRKQYVSGASQSDFGYDFRIFESTDLLVYRTPAGLTPDPDADLLSQSEYNVTGVNSQSGGLVQLVTPANAGDLITIQSNVSEDQTVDYRVGGRFAPETVDYSLRLFIPYHLMTRYYRWNE